MKKTIFTTLAFIAFAHFAFAQIPDCSELYFSEYLEGTGKNRAVEIYNPTNEDIDLSIYSIKVFASGPNNPNVMPLSGTLPSQQVHVCGHDLADSGILSLCDITSSELKFDGDDAVGLYKNDVLIDMIGQIGVNPGNTGWQVGAGFTKDNTLRRGFDVRGPTAFWSISVLQWDVLPIDDIAGLGDNDNVCSEATVEFVSTSLDWDEHDGWIKLYIIAYNPLTYDLAGRVSHNPNTANCIDPVLATRNADYETTMPQETFIEFTMPASSTTSGYVWIHIIDDDTYEPDDEAICFELPSGQNYTAVYPDKHTMMIIDNDFPSGINELNGDNVKIYPSMSNEYLSVVGVPDGVDVLITIYNIFGQQVMRKDSNTQQGKTRVEIEALTPGMYVLTLESLKGTVTKKFIKN